MDHKESQILQDKLHALVDGQLPSAQRDVLLAQVGGDAEAAQTLQAWRDQRDALRGLHADVLTEPVPPQLLAAARRSQQGQRQIDQWWRWGGMAAGLMLAFGVGWLSHGQLGQGSAGQTLASNAARPTQAFVRQASVAHAAFTPEVRHPVEVTAAQQDHLVQWLSKRLGKPLKVPVLAAQGYELVGGRLLPGDGPANGGVRAQFMFQNPAGLRITLYVGAVAGAGAAGASQPAAGQAPAPPASPESRETAFRYSADGPVPSFYWVDQGFGYALSGAVSRDELMKLSELVYQQL